MLTWVDELAFCIPGSPPALFSDAPLRHPLNTAAGLIGNNDFLPPADKARLAAFGAAGIAKCLSHPGDLDQKSLADYAAEFGVSADVIQRLIFTAIQAVLFLPADQFSSYAAFAPVAASLQRLMLMRLGAFNGGMTRVMIEPIANAITDRGGQIMANAPISDLVVDDAAVVGVARDGNVVRASHVVLAVPLKPAQDLLRPHFGQHEWFQPMLSLPSLSAATIQFELDIPMVETDRTNFSPTGICCFAEQSRTTFTHVAGRFSAILYPPEEFIHKEPAAVLERVLREADQLGIPLRGHIKDYRIVNHPHDFYAMHPGTEALRPEQSTPVGGLTLSGDYTKQRFSASMEGAVLSGRRAAEAVLSKD